MVLGDYYVEEDETPDVGQDDPTAANAAAADEMPPGTPRVSRAPKQGFYFLARQEARTPTPAGNPQKRQDYMLAQVKEVEPALGGFVLQKAQALSVAHRQGQEYQAGRDRPGSPGDEAQGGVAADCRGGVR